MIISISGPAGSGKSTIAKMLAKELDWPRYYIGGLRRQKAKERGMTLEEYNQLGEKDEKTDREVDEYQRELGKKEDDFVIEGRTSWYFIPQSLKIYIDVSDEVGAERVFKDLQEEEAKEKRNEGRVLNSLSDVLTSIRGRMSSDIKRYDKYYGINVYDKGNFDFVINTDKLNKDEVFAKVLAFVKEKI